MNGHTLFVYDFRNHLTPSRRASIQSLKMDLPQQTPQTNGSRWSEGVRALRHRNYRLFFAGQMISLIGAWMAPMGALLAGSLAHKLGAPLTVGIGGVAAIAGAGLFGLKLPSLRPAAREMIVAQQMAGGAPAQEMTGRVFTKTG